jgi:sugar lactone lactonase YvrE
MTGLCVFGLAVPVAARATDSWQVSLVAGGKHLDGPAAAAAFSMIRGIAWDPQGGVVVADAGNHSIRRVGVDGQVTTLAGSGAMGWRDGKGTEARFREPAGVSVDREGAVWVADTGNRCVRRISPDGTVTTVAGQALADGRVDGPGELARFSEPSDLAIASDGRIVVVDVINQAVRLVATNGVVSTVAQGYRGWPPEYAVGTRRQFLPDCIGVGPDGRWLIGEFGSYVRVSEWSEATGLQSMWGTGEFGISLDWDGGLGVAWDRRGRAMVSLNLWVTRPPSLDSTRHDGVYEVGEAGNLIPLAERLPKAGGDISNRLTTDSEGNVYVARGDQIVQVTERGHVTVLAGRVSETWAAGRGASASLRSVRGLARFPDGSLVVSETETHRLWRVSPDGGVTWWSGRAGGGFADGPAETACFADPCGLAVDRNGDVLVADSGNCRIRRVRPDGGVSTVVVGALNTQLVQPRFVAVDSTGSILFVELGAGVRVIQPDGTVTNRWDDQFSEARGNGWPSGLWIDAKDRVWASTKGRVLELLPDGSSVIRYDFADYVRPGRIMERPVIQAFTVDQGGNLWMAPERGYEVVRLSPRGVPLKIVSDTPGRASTQAPDGIGIIAPLLMAADPSGGIVFWDEPASALKRLTPKPGLIADVQVFPEMPNVALGRPLRLSAVTGEQTNPATFQWRRNGDPIAGQTQADLVVAPFTAELAGDYSVLMRHASSAVTSAPVRIGVMALPRIAKQPGTSVTAGGWPPDLMVIAEGEGELGYQWFRDDIEVRLSTEPVYLPGGFGGWEARYRVRVENEAGSVDSQTVSHSTWRAMPDGQVELIGPVGMHYRLESAESMAGPWRPDREFTLESMTNRWSLPTPGAATTETRLFRLIPITVP